MPRFGLVLIVGLSNACWFDAHYQSGQATCPDGDCPTGLVCNADHVCVTTPGGDGSGGVHDASDAPPHDSTEPPHDLTCTDPGTFVADSTVTGSTAGRTNEIKASCAGSVMNGTDAIYKINATVGQHVILTPHSSAFAVTAYLISPCAEFASCIGNVYATDTTPQAIAIPASTDYFIVVDSNLAAEAGAYSLAIAIQ